MSKHNSIIFLPSTTPLTPVPKHPNQFRGRLSQSISASFWTLPSSLELYSSSYIYSPTSPIFYPPIYFSYSFYSPGPLSFFYSSYYSYPSTTSPITPHLRLKLHPSLHIIIYPYFYPHYIPLYLLLTHNLLPPLHLNIRPLPRPLFIPIPITQLPQHHYSKISYQRNVKIGIISASQ